MGLVVVEMIESGIGDSRWYLRWKYQKNEH
jgi:hypothetical protein